MNTPNRRKLTLAGLGLVGAGGVLGLAVTSGAAFADPSTAPSSPVAPSSPAGSSPAAPSSPAVPGRDRDSALAGDLAAELGIDEAKVAAALANVREKRAAEARTERTEKLRTRLDTAVTEGRLTREQADAIRKAAESGVLNGPYGHGPGGHGRFGGEPHGR